MARQRGKSLQRGKGAERALQVATLRRDGSTFEEIGRALGITASTAHHHWKRYLDEVNAETRETVLETRDREARRLDSLQLVCMRVIDAGGRDVVPAILAALKIMERRAKLFGLDAPRGFYLDARVSVDHAGDELAEAVLHDPVAADLASALLARVALRTEPS